MALQGSMLDYRPPKAEDAYDPRVVRLMKQYGIWHPALVYPPGSKLAAQEQEIMAKIMDDISREDQVTESRELRRDTSTANREQRAQIHDENLAAVTADRENRSAIAQEAATTRRAQALQLLAADPNIDETTRNAAKVAIARDLGLTGAAPATGVQGEYGPGGASTQTNTTGYVPPAGTFGGTPTAPAVQSDPRSIENVMAQVPAGYDYNVNTGKLLPQDTVGMIGGRPAGEVLAEGARRTGIMPESASGRAAFAASLPNPPTAPEVAEVPMTNYTNPTAAFTTPTPPLSPGTSIAGRGEFRGVYPLAQNEGPRLLDFRSTPPNYVNPQERQRIIAEQQRQRVLAEERKKKVASR